MNKFYLNFLFFFSLTLSSAFAQQGVIRGTVYDESLGETMIGATVMAKGTDYGAITDFDGKFEIKLPVGTYDIQFSFISYETVIISGVEVTADQPVVFNNIKMKEAVSELEEVVVTAEVVRNSEAVISITKKKAVNLMDGMSAATFDKIGDSNASAAVKRITGVSVEGGKYVYVRGLGDRYTKTTLNNVDIPGLDPDRNSLQMDIFPTNLIDNMMVYKTAVAELSADFTGGVVNIETKDLPDTKILDVSLSVSYNPNMHFNSDYIMGNTSSTDFLGYDNGDRALPDQARQEVIPSPISGHSDQEVNNFLNEFNPTLGATPQTSFMDYSASFTSANQYDVWGSHKLGYIFSASYKSNTIYYDDVVYGEYQRFRDPDITELRYATIQNGVKAEKSVLAGVLAGLAYKTEMSKFKLTALHLQNGINTAGQFYIQNDGEAVGQSGYSAYSNNLEYNQRALSNFMLSGEHHVGNGAWDIDWRVSPTISKIEDPDVRKTAFTYSDSDTTFSAGAGGNPSRIWRELDETNWVAKTDITRNLLVFGRDAKVKFGGSYIYKERDYEILSYDLQFFGGQPDFGIDPNNVLLPENLYPNGTLYYNSGNNTPNPNAYNSNSKNTAGYISAIFNPTDKLKAVLGLRGENFVQRHTGRDVEYASLGTGNNLENDIVLDDFDLFPSVNLVYAVNDDQNLRLSYGKTIARPSFKELSYAQILDPLTNRIFNGGLFEYNDWDGNLSSTRVNNFDLRWEVFMQGSDIFSISAFYKTFDDPIELVRIPEQQTSTEYQPRNVGDGEIIGTEIEVKKSLAFMAEELSNFYIGTNLTLAKSKIDMTDREYNSRLQFEKEGEDIEKTRKMAGQAPFIINAALGYENFETGLDAGLFYNVKGRTLYIVGGGLFPDVYTQPFNSLNFNLNKRFGAEQNMSLNFSVSNILNDKREEVYGAYEADDQPFTYFNPGTTFSLGIKYSF